MQALWQSILGSLKSLSLARRQFAFVAVVVVALCLLTVITTNHSPMMIRSKTHPGIDPVLPDNFPSAMNSPDAEVDLKARTESAQALVSGGGPRAAFAPVLPLEPRIAYSADLGVITRDFVHARSSMEDILDRHRGYAARLRMVGNPAGSSLSATLKVPASEYSSALVDFKSIGDVQQDDEAADEVVQQRGDLDARFQNAQNNESRLQQLLNESNDKSIDVDYVRRQLIALHAEIVQLELQRHSFDNRVTFSSIHFSLREVRETPAETLSAQVRRAAASGLTDLIATLSTLLVFLVSYGPSFLLWAAVLFFPARYLWRRTRVSIARETA